MQARRAAIYARFSTDLQSERSVDDQVALCREFAARRGFVVAHVYADRARSGASVFGRDGLLALMDDARAGKFEVVVIEALDRLSRDQEDLAGIHKRLSFAGIEIIAVHDGTADAIQIGIRGLVSTLFLADLKNKIRRGIRDGRHAGGRAYGYRPVPGQPGVLQIVEDEANIVRRIFSEIIDGMRPREIAAGLNRDGVPPPRGIAWNASTINGSAKRANGIVRNLLYSGRIVWNRARSVRDPETGKRISRQNDPSEHRYADAPHLAIVDADVQQKAIAIVEKRGLMKRNREFTQRPKRLLSGILRCGMCGGGMSVHDRRGEAVRIRCSRSIESGVCENTRRYRLDRIETAVVNGLREQLAHPELLAEYVRTYREERRKEAMDAIRERASRERRAAELKGQMAKLIQAMMRGSLPIELVEEQCKPLQVERDEILAALAATPDESAALAIELHPQAAIVYRSMVENLANRMSELHPVLDAEAFKAFRDLVDSVIVRDTANNGVEVEIIGHLSALLGKKAEMLGGRVVAEEGFEPPTQGL
jgi:site-specific DNA recombinase